MNPWMPVLIAFQITLGPPPPPAPAPIGAADDGVAQVVDDRWFAEDKLKHYFMSFAATNLAYGAVRMAGLESDAALLAAGGASAAAGLWKEWRDRRAGGPFSTKDLVWDGLGIGTGLVLAGAAR